MKLYDLPDFVSKTSRLQLKCIELLQSKFSELDVDSIRSELCHLIYMEMKELDLGERSEWQFVGTPEEIAKTIFAHAPYICNSVQGVDLSLEETNVLIEHITDGCAEQGWGELDHFVICKLYNHKRTLEALQKESDNKCPQ